VMRAFIGGAPTQAQTVAPPAVTPVPSVTPAQSRNLANGQAGISMPPPGPVVPPPVFEARPPAPASVDSPVVAATSAPATAPVATASRPARAELQQVLLDVVSDRTGYPVEVISL